MSKLSRIIALLVLAVIVAAGVFLATWQIPPPVARVEKVIPNERFPR